METLSTKIKFIHKGLGVNVDLQTPLTVQLLSDTQKVLLHLLLSQLKDCTLGENVVTLQLSCLEALYRTGDSEEAYQKTEADSMQLFALKYSYNDDSLGIIVELRIFDVMRINKAEGEVSFLFNDRYARQVERRIS